MAIGQLIAKPQYYGTELGRAWAHVFWFGFLLFFGPILTWFTRYVANHKNPRVADARKYQVVGVISITGVVGLSVLVEVVRGNDSLTGYDGDARRGMFVIWLLLILIFTVVNVAVLILRQLKLRKRP